MPHLAIDVHEQTDWHFIVSDVLQNDRHLVEVDSKHQLWVLCLSSLNQLFLLGSSGSSLLFVLLVLFVYYSVQQNIVSQELSGVFLHHCIASSTFSSHEHIVISRRFFLLLIRLNKLFFASQYIIFTQINLIWHE